MQATVRILSTLVALLPTTAVGPGIGSGQGKSVASSATYSRAVTRICAGALLFEAQHELGTRTGALAVARDIRASTRRRLVRVAAVPAPAGRKLLTERWMVLEQRLADVYARSWVRIYDAIDAGTRANEARVLRRILSAPDDLRRAAARMELTLDVPDCTGGDPVPAPSRAPRS